jgi:hypothetical protein
LSDTIFLGIDPGVSGGFAALLPNGTVMTAKMPNDSLGICDFLLMINDGPEIKAAIEKVGGWIGGRARGEDKEKAGQPGSHMFIFGKNVGRIEGVMAVYGIDPEEVHPNQWQKYLSIPRRAKQESKASWKRRCKAEAQRMFPSVQVTLNTSDALLIADWLRRKHEDDTLFSPGEKRCLKR